MEHRSKGKPLQTRPNSLRDPKERERILMQYGGIFKHSIKDFAEKVIRRTKARTNYSR